MNVLIIARDTQLLLANDTAKTDVLSRHELYEDRLRHLAPGSELRIFVIGGSSSFSRWRRRGRLNIASCGISPMYIPFFHLLLTCLMPRSRLLGAWTPDVVTSQSPEWDGLWGLILAWRVGARFVAQVHFKFGQMT